MCIDCAFGLTTGSSASRTRVGMLKGKKVIEPDMERVSK